MGKTNIALVFKSWNEEHTTNVRGVYPGWIKEGNKYKKEKKAKWSHFKMGSEPPSRRSCSACHMPPSFRMLKWQSNLRTEATLSLWELSAKITRQQMLWLLHRESQTWSGIRGATLADRHRQTPAFYWGNCCPFRSHKYPLLGTLLRFLPKSVLPR